MSGEKSLFVMPAKAGIQKHLIILDSRQEQAGMTVEGERVTSNPDVS